MNRIKTSFSTSSAYRKGQTFCFAKYHKLSRNWNEQEDLAGESLNLDPDMT